MQNTIDLLIKFLPLLIPILLLQLAMMAYGLFDLSRREHTRGPKWMWVILLVVGQLWGPILYFLVGREE